MSKIVLHFICTNCGWEIQVDKSLYGGGQTCPKCLGKLEYGPVEIGETLFGKTKHYAQLWRCAIGDLEHIETDLASIKEFLQRPTPTLVVTRNQIDRLIYKFPTGSSIREQRARIIKWLKEELGITVEDNNDKQE